MIYSFTPPAVVGVPVVDSPALFPVHRIYCVGRNYEEHAKEMGGTGREAPFFFMKPADGVLYCITAAGEAAGGRIKRGKKYELCREAEKIALRRKKRWVTPQQNNTKRAKVAVVDHSDDVCASAIQQYF